MKTDEIIEEAEYFSFLSVNVEFREDGISNFFSESQRPGA